MKPRNNPRRFFYLLAFLIAGDAHAALSLSAPLHAKVTPVVELYTSEGCSSCPPAERWLQKLGGLLDDDLRALPLAFHVDYWNRLGWVDPFSSAQFTARQKHIAQLNRQYTIYTPEFTVAGRETRGARKILARIREANQQAAQVSLSLDARAPARDHLSGEIRVHNACACNAHAFIAVFENAIVREIYAGENRGRTLRHDFVVRHWSRPIILRAGDNQRMWRADLPANAARENLGLALVVIDAKNGATLQTLSAPLGELFAH